jgi:TM2 domain-containing membrane protein YozV
MNDMNQNYGYAAQPQPQPQPGYQMPPTYQEPPVYQQAMPAQSPGFGSVKKDKWAAALIVLLMPLLGALGIHKFYLGYKTEGIIMLVVTLAGSLCAGLGLAVMTVISVIEAVRYLTLTQEDFEQRYVYSRKGWFYGIGCSTSKPY